jgi:hypothetical protein
MDTVWINPGGFLKTISNSFKKFWCENWNFIHGFLQIDTRPIGATTKVVSVCPPMQSPMGREV